MRNHFFQLPFIAIFYAGLILLWKFVVCFSGAVHVLQILAFSRKLPAFSAGTFVRSKIRRSRCSRLVQLSNISWTLVTFEVLKLLLLMLLRANEYENIRYIFSTLELFFDIYKRDILRILLAIYGTKNYNFEVTGVFWRIWKMEYKLSEIENKRIWGRCSSLDDCTALFWTGSGIEVNVKAGYFYADIEKSKDWLRLR